MRKRTKAETVRKCEYCGRTFVSPGGSHRGRFCSRSCSRAAQTVREAPKYPPDRCRNCGQQLLDDAKPYSLCYICSMLPDDEARREYRRTGIIYHRRCHKCGGLTNDYICAACRGVR